MTRTDEIRRKIAQYKPELENGFQVNEIGPARDRPLQHLLIEKVTR